LAELITTESAAQERQLAAYRKSLQHPELCILNHWIYCDIFHHSIAASYRSVHVPAQLPDVIRLDYLRYCVPDKRCRNVDFSVEFPNLNETIHPHLALQQHELMELFKGTSYEISSFKYLLGYKEFYYVGYPRNARVDIENHTADIVLHQGLLTMKIVLATRAKGEERADRTDLFVSPAFPGEALVRELDEIKQKVRRAHEDGEYKNIQDATWPPPRSRYTGPPQVNPAWQSLATDIHQLWRLQARQRRLLY